jgi:hypothetical protein
MKLALLYKEVTYEWLDDVSLLWEKRDFKHRPSTIGTRRRSVGFFIFVKMQWKLEG